VSRRRSGGQPGASAAVHETPSTQQPAAQIEPSAERRADFEWNGRPVYRCRRCNYERVENLAAVLEHEATIHQLMVRASQIIGADGAPLLVEG